MSQLNWSEKYRPKKLDDIFLNSEDLKLIGNWMNDFKNKTKNFKNCLFLHGPPGIGKTTIASLILSHYNFEILEFNSSEVRSQKLIKERLNQVNSNISILDSLCNKNVKHFGIIFDEIDGVSSGEKGGIGEINNIIFEKGVNNNSPFICISNTINKKLDTIKKKSIYLKVKKPNKATMMKILDKICDSENILVNDSLKMLIVSKSTFDIRRLINLTEFLFRKKKLYDYENDEKMIENIEKLIEGFDSKNIYLTSYEAADKILNKYHNIDTTLSLYEFDKNNIGMFLFENFINYLAFNTKNPNIEKLKKMSEIFDNYSESDQYERAIFMNQKYSLFKYNCILKCSIPSHVLNSMNKFPYNKYNKLNYSTLINKSSQEFNNSKSFTEIKKKFTNFCDSDIHITICNILYKYIEDEKDNIKDLIKQYNLDKELIEKIVKYSSFYTEKTTLKKQLKKLCV